MIEYLFEGILRTPDELQAIATHRAKRIRELEAEVLGYKKTHRWNIDADGERLTVCRGEHDGDRCWEHEEIWVPLPVLEAAEAKVTELEASALGGYEDGWHTLRAERDELKAKLLELEVQYKHATGGCSAIRLNAALACLEAAEAALNLVLPPSCEITNPLGEYGD